MNKDVATVPTEAASLMSVISKAATDPAVDVEKMRGLWELYERMDTRRAERAFSEAMSKAQAEMPQMYRDKENSHKGYSYTTLEGLNAKAVPIYSKHGFALSFGTKDGAPPGHYRITCHVSHVDGFSRDYQADLPTDMVGDKGNPNKTAIQGFGSSMSYGRRYMTLLIFNITTTGEDNDGEGGGSGTITDEQAHQIDKIIADNGFPLDAILAWAKIARIADLPADRFDKFMMRLNEKVRAKGAGK